MTSRIEFAAAFVAFLGIVVVSFRRRRAGKSAVSITGLGLLVALALVHFEDGLQWAGDVEADRIGESVRLAVPLFWLFLLFSLRQEDLLRQVEGRCEQLRFFLSRAPVASALLDHRGRFLECNEEWLARSNCSLAELVRKDRSETTRHVPEFVDEAFRRASSEKGVVGSDEPTLISWAGRDEWVEWKARAISDSPGAGDGVMILADVVTERVEAERRARREEGHLAHAQRIALVGELASGVAHDLNNYLQVIAGQIEAVAAPDSEEERARALEGLGRATAASIEIVRSLLAMSRRGTGVREPVDVVELARSTLELLRRTRPVDQQLIADAAEGPLFVRGVRVRLQQLLLNLIVNAEDAMPDGGSIVVGVRQLGASIELSVTDTGTGIPPELRTKIFERFFTTKPEGRGTGLGLALVRAIALEHGGRVDVESTLGKGSTFTVTLPVDEGAPKARSQEAKAAAAAFGSFFAGARRRTARSETGLHPN